MNRKILSTAIAGLLVLTALCVAQPRGEGPGSRRPGGFQPRPQMDMLQMFDQITGTLAIQLDLAPWQVERYNTMVAKQRSAIEETLKQLHKQREQFDADLQTLLTAEQKERMKTMRPDLIDRGFGQGLDQSRMLTRAIGQLDLTTAQDAQIKTILDESQKELREAADAERQAREKTIREMMEKINKVLTTSQSEQFRTNLAEMRTARPRGPGGERPEGFDRERGAGREQRRGPRTEQ